MRVCMIAYSFYEGDTRILQYASALADRGDTVDVIALRRPGQPARTTVNGVNVFHVQTRMKNERGPFSYLYRILRFLVISAITVTRLHLKNRYNLIHVHSVPDFLVFAAIIPRIMGTPVILDIHDVLPEFYASKFNASHDSLVFRMLAFVERISIAFSSHAIVANHLWCERVAARSKNPQKCSPIRNYPTPQLFNPNLRTHTNGKFLITYPGSLNWHQGVDVAINAFAKIKDELPEAEFHIYGEGPVKESLVKQADTLGLRDRVVFHGFLPTKDIVRVMANTDLAVEPKRSRSAFGNEALSMKILEFMSVGVPVVASRTKTHAFYYTDSLVKYYDGDSDDELAANIILLKQDTSLREKLISNGLKYAENNNWNVEKGQYLRIVDTLVAG